MLNAVWNGVRNLGVAVLRLASLALVISLTVAISVSILFGVCIAILRDTLLINRPKDSVVERKDSPAQDELLGSFGEEMLESLGQTESRKDSIH
jgi:hypothetical protein